MECEPMHAVDDDGWTEWIHPLPGYLMQCCDCGLIHEMEAVVARRKEQTGDGRHNYDDVEDADIVVLFRMRRRDDLGGSPDAPP